MGRRSGGLVVVAVFALLAPGARGGPVGVAVMGDSIVDEYEFAVAPPGRGGGVAKGAVEILAETRSADLTFGAFSAASRGEPRNKGYEFNWAREEFATTSADLLAQGQHTGAAGQAASGRVTLGVLVVGGNDFRSIFLAPDPVAALSEPGFVPGILTNIATAAQTFLVATPGAKLVVANIPDVTKLPRSRAALAANPAAAPLFAAVEGVIDLANAGLASTFSGNDRVAVADLNGLFDRILSEDDLRVGSHAIDRDGFGTSPDELFVDDLHPGTVGQAWIANLLLGTANDRFDWASAR